MSSSCYSIRDDIHVHPQENDVERDKSEHYMTVTLRRSKFIFFEFTTHPAVSVQIAQITAWQHYFPFCFLSLPVIFSHFSGARSANCLVSQREYLIRNVNSRIYRLETLLRKMDAQIRVSRWLDPQRALGILFCFVLFCHSILHKLIDIQTYIQTYKK